MHLYFKTKAQAKQIEHEKKRQEAKKRMEIAKEKAFWEAYHKVQDEKDRNEINAIYRMLRYWLPLDGTLANYVDNYANPYIRHRRVLFLEEEHTSHSPEIQTHIDTVLSKRTDSE